MDWRNYALILLAVVPLANCWTPIKSAASPQSVRQKIAVSPYIDIALCPIQQQPWSCAREQSARILDIWDDELHSQWQKLKVEADRQLNATIEKRGYSATEIPTKEKPSTILKKIEIGTSFMKEYLAESMDGFLGHEFEYMQNSKAQQKEAVNDDEDDDSDADNDDESEFPAEDEDDDDNENDEDDDEPEDEDEKANDEVDDDANNDKNVQNVNVNANSNAIPNTFITSNVNSYSTNDAFDADKSATVDGLANSSNGDEFIEIKDANHVEQLQQAVNKQVKKKNKNKKQKKKGQKGHQQLAQPANFLVVQQAEPPQHNSNKLQNSESSFGGHGHKIGDKRKKRKKRPGHSDSVSTVIVEEAPSNHLGFELLEELVGEQELFSGGSGKRKRKNKHPSKYGRSNGVTRGKKKKKKKAIAKLILLGSILKAKIELLLKILGAHLQIKFFAIAFIGLLINIARFWIDVKRGGVPQKVIYVEHAHHQHHYEDHGSEDWSEGAGGSSGSYWKRSLQTDPTVDDNASTSYTDSYQPQQPQQLDAQYLAYRNQWH